MSGGRSSTGFLLGTRHVVEQRVRSYRCRGLNGTKADASQFLRSPK